jgi:photosystem II stability/assembly factor-like uncharacterized protein
MVTPVRCLCLLLPFLAPETVRAGENIWTTNGPPGSITALSSASASVLAGSSMERSAVAYRSLDGGASWSALGELPIYWSISDFLIDPLDPARIYAAANYGYFTSNIYRSDDGGSGWTEVASLRGNVFDLAVRSDRPGTLYAAASSCSCPCRLTPVCFAEVWKSVDFGATWQSVRTGLAGSAIRALAIDPLDPNRIYAASDAGVFVSTDAGDQWSAVNVGLQCYPVFALAIRPSDGVLFAGTAWASPDRFFCGGVFRSHDGGQSWQSTGLSAHYVKSLAIDPTNPQTIYAGAGSFIGFFSPGGGIFRSEDGGETWAPIGSGLPPRGVDRLVVESSGRTVHAATSEGVFDYEIVPGARPPVVPPRTRGTRTLPARP